ncbi:MAG: hypothetical protein K6E18_06300 [Lachnospiraceae bacterium]|nr:hypothetical protein [Lachnospiraceae bacterium]
MKENGNEFIPFEEDGEIAKNSEDALQVTIGNEETQSGADSFANEATAMQNENVPQQEPQKRNYEKYLEGEGFEQFATPPQAPDMMPEMLNAHDTYYQAPAPAPVAPVNPAALEGLEEPVSMGEWLVSMLLMMIPCVNLVLVFVWAFSKTEKKSKSNFFKAQLIIMGVILAIYVLLFVVMIFFGIAAAM